MSDTDRNGVPSWLKAEAKQFWNKHWHRLCEEGAVDATRDVEGFSLLCEVWRILRHTDPCKDSKEGLRYGAMLKQYQALAKQYGLMPKDRKASGFDKPKDALEILKKLKAG
jgi:phage terminase small subunit